MPGSGTGWGRVEDTAGESAGGSEFQLGLGDCLRQKSRAGGWEGAAPLPSSQAFPQNQMLQSRRQDLEAQIRGLREEVEKGQGRLQTTHEELLLLRRERREHNLEVTCRARGYNCLDP